MAAPLLFYGLTPAAYLATQATYRLAFIIINFWFVVAELGFWVFARRNFIEEYLNDWNPKEVRQQGVGFWQQQYFQLTASLLSCKSSALLGVLVRRPCIWCIGRPGSCNRCVAVTWLHCIPCSQCS
jgi:hypothetical protein